MTEDKKAIEPEIVEDKLSQVVTKTGIKEPDALALRGQFTEFYEVISDWQQQAETITDPADATQQALARKVRLGVKSARCDVERVRKALKADSLARGKAIDGFANVLKYMCEPLESKMLEIEQHAARKEAARVAAIVEERTAALVLIGADPNLYKLDAMDDAGFKALLETVKQAQELQAKAEAEAQAERERKEREEAEARAKLEAENKKLREEKEKAAREALKEKRKRQAEAAKAKLEADKVAEAKRREEEAKIKAEQAPDKEKVEAFAVAIELVKMPVASTANGAEIMRDIAAKQRGFSAWIREQGARL